MYAHNTDNAKEAAYPAINDDQALIPTIPLLVEQRQIVAKIEELISLIKNM